MARRRVIQRAKEMPANRLVLEVRLAWQVVVEKRLAVLVTLERLVKRAVAAALGLRVYRAAAGWRRRLRPPMPRPVARQRSSTWARQPCRHLVRQVLRRLPLRRPLLRPFLRPLLPPLAQRCPHRPKLSSEARVTAETPSADICYLSGRDYTITMLPTGHPRVGLEGSACATCR